MTAPKLLHLPNDLSFDEITETGPRMAFRSALAAGELSDVLTVPFLAESCQVGEQRFTRSLLERARQFQPDIILWHHVSEFPVDQRLIAELRGCGSCPLLAYHEGDAYGRFVKPITTSMRILCREADVVFLSALGPMARIVRQAGARDVRYSASFFDPDIYGRPPDPALVGCDFDAVLIGNLVRRIPYLRELPGATDRFRLARKLSTTLGPRFAVFGDGWDCRVNAHGSLPRFDQHSVIQRALVSVNWDHYPHYDYYFSDRLPISLAAGIPHVTCYHPGYENIFRGVDGLFWANSVDEAIDTVRFLLSLGKERLLLMGAHAREFVLATLSAETVFRKLLRACIEKKARAQHG